jgi:hypothetical protein
LVLLPRIVEEYNKDGAVSKRLALKEKGDKPTLERKRARKSSPGV